MFGGKKNIYILSSIYGITSTQGQDQFRRTIGNYWIKQPIQGQYGDTSTFNVGLEQDNDEGERRVRKVDTFKMIPRSSSLAEQNKFPYFIEEEKFEIYAPKEYYGSEPGWINEITRIVGSTESEYTDYNFTLDTPFTEEESNILNSTKTGAYVSSEFEYNYFSLSYERLVSSPVQPESVLPNIYNFVLYNMSENSDKKINDKVFQALTAGGQIEKNFIGSVRTFTEPDPNIKYFNYFDAYGNNTNINPTQVSDYMNTIIFGLQSDELQKEVKKITSAFPMHVELKFTTDQTTEFAEILEDSKMTRSLMSYLSKIPRDYNFRSFSASEAQKYSINTFATQRIFEQVSPPEPTDSSDGVTSAPEPRGYRLEGGDLRFIDLSSWFASVFNQKEIEENQNAIYLEEETRKMTPQEKSLYLIIFSGKIKSFLKKHRRNYKKISDGKRSYSETICYKIEKFNSNLNNPLQTIWMPNTSRTEIMTYIDTQVKYDTEYTYRVSAYQVVVGTDYSYNQYSFPDIYDETSTDEDFEEEVTEEMAILDVDGDLAQSMLDATGFTDARPLEGQEDMSPLEIGTPDTQISDQTPDVDTMILSDRDIYETKYANELFVTAGPRQRVDTVNNFRADLSIRTFPFIGIVEVPYFETKGSIIDSPPVFPDVNIIPYRNISNKILINLNSNHGEYELEPITFDESEREIVQKIKQVKKTRSSNTIKYSTDDRVRQFEVYRMETKPEKIEDFIGNLRNTVTTDISEETPQKASSASLIDEIQPNMDYYYMFRAIDVHGHISNPTEVYRVRMVLNSGVSYPLIETYRMEKIEPKNTSKTCKKLLSIQPEFLQTIINKAKSDYGDGTSAKNVKNIILGVKQSPLFGRTFKVRLTSKHTGKQIDLNITFDVELHKN